MYKYNLRWGVGLIFTFMHTPHFSTLLFNMLCLACRRPAPLYRDLNDHMSCCEPCALCSSAATLGASGVLFCFLEASAERPSYSLSCMTACFSASLKRQTNAILQFLAAPFFAYVHKSMLSLPNIGKK